MEAQSEHFKPGGRVCGAGRKAISEWTVEDVCHWLRGGPLGDIDPLVDLIERHAISGRVLLRLTDAKLETMGVGAKSRRLELMALVLELRLQQETEELLQITEW